ncbi:MAG: hypothetical protein JWL79_2933 [Frankiales bacterium]|nr:hypothetical protein [Frankiales bacterium]
MTTLDPIDPESLWPEGHLDEVRTLDAKPLARRQLDMVTALPAYAVERDNDLREASDAQLRDLCEQINAAFATERAYTHDAMTKAVLGIAELLVAEMTRREVELRAIFGREVQDIRALAERPLPVPLDLDAMARTLAAQVVAALPSVRRATVKHVERDRDGEVVRIVEHEADLDDDDLGGYAS